MALEIDWLSRLFSVDMGIDLGTCNTLVCVRGEGIVLNEPSVVAVRKGTNIVLNNGEAVGFAAKDMLGKTPGSISAVRPLKDGVISDFAVTEAMLGYFIKKVNGKSTRIFGPRVVIAIPWASPASRSRPSMRALSVPVRAACIWCTSRWLQRLVQVFRLLNQRQA